MVTLDAGFGTDRTGPSRFLREVMARMGLILDLRRRSSLPTLSALRLLGQLDGGAARNDDGRDGRMADDLGGARTEEHAGHRPEDARADHQHVAVVPLDVLQRLLPGLPVSGDRLDLVRDERELLDLLERLADGRAHRVR